MGIAEDCLREHAQFASSRHNWETYWSQIAERVLMRQDDFINKRSDGEKRDEKVFDATAPLALERFSAVMDSMLTPRTQKWHKLRASNKDLNKLAAVKKYFDEVSDVLFEERYRPRANFGSQNNERWVSLGAFGTGILMTAENPEGGLHYKSVHLAEAYIAENAQGMVDKLHRKFQFTARQASQQFGESKLPEKIRGKLATHPEEKFWFLHVVKPNGEYKPGRLGVAGKRWISIYIAMDDRHEVSIGGFNTFPYAVSRYVTAPLEVYGRSPAMLVLPDIKMLNEMSKTTIRGAHRRVAPPLLIHDDGMGAHRMSVRPDAMNYGMVSPEGRPLVQPLLSGGDIGLGLEMEDQRRRVINDAFLVTLFQILVDNPKMTATEVLERAREKGVLLAPTVGRQQSEALGPQVEREIDILARQGRLPEMPEVLREARGDYQIEYESPLNRAMRADEGIAVLRTLEAAGPLAQIDPDVLDRIKTDETLQLMAEINGMPSRLLRDDSEVEGVREKRARMREVQSMLEAAPIAAGTAKTMAEAQQIAQAGAAGRV